MKLYLRMLQYTQKYWRRIFLALLCIVIATAANVSVPWIIKNVIDNILQSGNMWLLNLLAAGIIALFIARGVALFGQNYLIQYVGQRAIADIRTELFRHVNRLSMTFFERQRTGAIMSHLTNDVAAIQTAITAAFIDLFTESFTLIGSLGVMFYINWQLTLITIVVLPLVAYTINIFGKKIRRASGVIQGKAADITTVLQETISSIRVVKSFAREDYETERFHRENMQNFQATIKGAQLSATLTPIIEFLGAIAVTLIIWFGGSKVIAGDMTSGELIAFLIYVVNISNPIKRLSNVYSIIQQAMAAAERIFKLMDTQPDIKEVPNAKALATISGGVHLANVSFAYNNGETVLEDITIGAKPGEVVALVGPSGSGKTTLVNLIPRFYDPVAGCITIDGIDIRTVKLQSLREQIGIVPQETVLFSGTIRDNILYGKLDASDDEIFEAAQAANAHSFIMAMPEGYQTQIGERGVKLSGGQRQRIAIARALLKNPRVLILDEATSALDTESEKLVQEALDKLMVGRTTFVIAHRLSTVRQADKIVVLDKHRVVEIGTHEELLVKSGLYSHLYRVQFKDKRESGN